MRLRIIFLALLCVVSLHRSAQAGFLWFFDEPLKYQSITLAVIVEKDKIPVARFIGQTMVFESDSDNAPTLSVVLKAQDLYHDRQLRVLVPRIAQTRYRVSLTGLEKGESLAPKMATITEKTFELIIMIKPAPKPQHGEGGEKKH